MLRTFGILLAVFAVACAKARRQMMTCAPQDIVFMVDSSEGVGADNFRKELDLIKQSLTNYNISPGCTRIGIVTFGSGASNQFFLNTYTSPSQISQAIDNIRYVPGRRHTTEGLKFATEQSFSTLNGARPNAQHIGVIVTNGPPSSEAAFLQQAQTAKNNGIKLYTVGVGTGPHLNTLSSAASAPNTKYAMMAQNFDTLSDLAYPLSRAINTESVAVPSSTAGCLQQADLVFLVDGSGSIGATNFQKQKEFLKSLVGSLNVGANGVHVGLMEFSNYPSLQFQLNKYSSRGDVIQGIENMKYMSGGTNTADGINAMTSQMFSTNGGARPNVPRIAVVITDGRSQSSVQTTAAANSARQNNVGMMAIGVGNGVDINELHAIADDPDNENTFTVNNFDQLANIKNAIINRACQVRTTMAPQQTNNQPVNTALDPCQDRLADCRSYGGPNMCVQYAGWAKDNCARFCGICQPLYTTAPPPCVDHLNNCASFGIDVCTQSAYVGWAKDNCKKFCGYCGDDPNAGGFHGKCNYKGKEYATGERWDDGCDYECTCEDGDTGKYKCYNKCPLYYNLPAQCTLVSSPTECCQVPVCNFQQSVQTFQQTSPAVTPSGLHVCSYKGNQYIEKETWQDGCQYQCTCVNGNQGLIKCQDLCQQYTSLPSYCHMEKKAGECCAKPVCEFNTQHGSFTGYGAVSGPGIAINPTPEPPCVDTVPNCERYDATMCTAYKGWASEHCRKHCNLCNLKPTPTNNDTCLYDGRPFHQGEAWQLSCDTTCVCENAIYGYYRCVNSCPTYNNLPQGCYETKKAGECCSTVQCDTGKFLTSTNNLNTIGSGGLITIQRPPTPQIMPTIPSGGTPAPGTGGTGFLAPSMAGCLYKGKVYIQDQMWDDGCTYSCECKDASRGFYQCTAKCPTYSNLPATCHMETDEENPCCQIPKCNDPATPLIPVFSAGTTGYGIVKPPSYQNLFNSSYTISMGSIYTHHYTMPTVNPNTNPGGIGHCTYKGVDHAPGTEWLDGCAYNCTCEDASIGKWRCVDRCPSYDNIPAQYCHLVEDPNDHCCKVPVCNFTGVIDTIHGTLTPPIGSVTTQQMTLPPATTQPPPKMCVYKGNMYSQGQMWYDGCQLKCTCDDASVGYYRCSNRCPEYMNVPDQCTMVPDSQDPACCRVPECHFTPKPNTIGGTGTIPTLAPPVISGQNPNQTLTNIGYCMYKGVKYQQGQAWKDGCDYNCRCDDASKGYYECTALCPRYGNLPYPCVLKTDFRNPCCKVPDCTFNPNFNQITGTQTPSPGPQYTGAPTPKPSPGPGQPSPQPTLNYCMYNGAKYYQGQTWDDGCDKRCRCDRADQGLYVCDERCPTYNNLPSVCHLEVSTTDPCCREPKCDLTPIYTNQTGTLRPDMIPTLAPPGQITGAVITPTPGPTMPGQVTQAPQPLNYCEYKGTQYQQGQVWDDGCDYTCECTDASKGAYKCTEKCPKYSTLPQQCYLQKDPANPCCMKPQCSFNPTINQVIGQGTTLAPPQGATGAPTPGPGMPTPNPFPTPALPKDVCVYKGKSYTQGQQWFDGCDYTCNCENAQQGVYRCSERCAEYSGLPAGCTLKPDPADPMCCKVPECQIPPQYTNTSGYVPIPKPTGVINGGSVTEAPTPSPLPGQPTPSPMPGQPTPRPDVTPIPRNVCVYKGSTYTQGQKWQDGCDYNCECVDSMNGNYRCTEICPKYATIPPMCKLVMDPNQPCCKQVYCDFTSNTGTITNAPIPGQQTTLVPQPGQPTPSPNPNPTPAPKSMCVYHGASYAQGARWDDGCDLKCVCENAVTGFYRCNDRCARYPNVPAGCYLTTDPKDSCCRVPVCNPMTPNPSSGTTLSPNPNQPITPAPTFPTVPAVIIGQGVTPTPSPGSVNPSPNPNPMCVYNGKSYAQGQNWDDGCTLRCTCTDAMSGQYRCVERCQSYLNLPANCRLQVDPKDSCCQVPFCDSPNPTPGTTIAPNPYTGLPTPAPTPYTGSPTPGPQTTQTPQPKDVCLMNGRQYTQGQQWYDGCSRTCVCEDGKTGFYRCTDRCRKFDHIPSTCTMVADPNDPQCCQIPNCVPNPNNLPTAGPNPTPTVITGVPVGIVNGYGTPTPTPPVVGPTATPTPAPKEVCLYKGTEYGQGQRWVDGCQYTCVCIDGKTGHYECTEKCPTYPRVPSACHLETDMNDVCCQKLVCNFQTPTPGPNTTPAPNPSGTLVPPTGTTVSPAPTQPPSFCVYQGIPYTQGQTWYQGCDKKCRCDDASKQYYTCQDRCPVYPNTNGCVMRTDPNDPCCQVPECTVVPTPQPTPNPNPINNPTPGTGPTFAPTPGTTAAPVPTAPIGQVIGSPQTPTGKCIYNGKQYSTGQKWDDGCSYTCECLDEASGQYKCNERCAKYPVIPSYCTMVQDPNDQCCQTPSCPNLVPTLAPNHTPNPSFTLVPPSGTTSSPGMITTPVPNPLNPTPTFVPVPKDVCIMSGKSYTQGQKWDDGCDRTCVCDDGKTGHYSCNDRCAKYNNIGPNCILVPDPQDPTCCKVPQCTQPNPNNPTGVIGTVTGTNPYPTPMPTPGGPTQAPNPFNTPTPGPNGNPTPSPVPTPYPGGTYPPNMIPTAVPNPFSTPAPGTGSTPQPPQVCVYKGKMYQTGQKWRDGCDYDCVCDNGMTGHYTCNQVCARYPNLPAQCTMEMDPNNPCCKVPNCNPTAAPVITPSPMPGQNPTPGTTQTPNPKFCIYNGIPYQQGQTWNDGCSKTCKCEDADSRQVTCNDRCPTFPPQTQPGCTLVTDPNDQCCQVPQCINTNTTNPTAVVTGTHGTITGSNLPQPGTGPVTTGRNNGCLYNGKLYQQGQTWDDGCTYRCACVDSNTGRYQCTDRCARVPQLPSFCTMINDPTDTCCKTPYCQSPSPTQAPNPSQTPVPQPGFNPTPSPSPQPKGMCVYNGQYYKQDQVWYDGCNAICRCEDASVGYHRCQERCARYPQVDPSCTMVPSPSDPSCCQEPSCPLAPTAMPQPTPGFVQTVTSNPGVITGLGPIPNPIPTPGPDGQTPATPQPKTGCMYKGVIYPKGTKWDDGCQYTCTCLDDMSGQYQCVEKCQTFPNLDRRCVLIQDPNNPCCQKPYCDMVNPVPFPNGYPTPSPPTGVTPNPMVTVAPNPTTPAPGNCVYKGVFYNQGQQWMDGCSKTCQCDDSVNGYYSCHERCQTYNNIPAGCTLKTDPQDNCCLVPYCPNSIPTPGPTPNQPVTLTPGTGPSNTGSNTTPTPQYIYPTPIMPGSFTGTGTNPNSNQPGSSITGARNTCYYKGNMYSQGQKWDDGCDYQCECIDAVRGQYKCQGRCPQYYFLPPQCTYVQDPKDQCCKVAQCDMNAQPTPKPTTNPQPHSTGNPIVITPSPSSGTGGQNTPPNPVTTSITGANTMCIYKGQMYQKGQQWNDGCEYKCICDDPTTNAYRCLGRCKAFSTIPSFCSLVDDPADQCCKKVYCTPSPSTNNQVISPMLPTNGPTASPTLSPSITNVVPVGTHDVFSGSSHVPGTTGTVSGGRNVCVFKSKVYNQGDSWDDGCDYTCTCEDAKAGRYTCATKCPKYPPLPSYCQFVNVPGQCCPTLTCNSPDYGKYTPTPQLVPNPQPTLAPGQTPTLGPNPQIIVVPGSNPTSGGTNPTTVVSGTPLTSFTGNTNMLCIYKNKIYNQDDQWTDGCQYSCTCKDATSGYYECQPLCPTYSNLPSQCFLEQTGSQCCSQPRCRNPDGTYVNPLNGNSVYPVFGTYGPQTTGFRPGYVSGTSTTTGSRQDGCIYKGRMYQAGTSWEDGCDYDCTCTDGKKGLYTCRAKCPTYTKIPALCQMYDVPGQCCKEIRCDTSQVPTAPPSPTPKPNTPVPHLDPNCYDAIGNCNQYQADMCTSYQAWARQNCNLTCQFCVPTVTTAPTSVSCQDSLNNCKDFGSSACIGIYKPWALDNCRKTCGYCSGSGSQQPVQTTPATCRDNRNDCNSYGQYACEGIYAAWAHDNCAAYCGFCTGTGNPVTQTINSLPPQGWTILMKGVAGAPGDLYTIWNTPGGVNENVQQAMYLTSTYPAHFKPSLSDHWNELCIDMVKVSIYNKGVEKAWIIFNAIGANKNSWFDPSRIINSSYGDINTAQKAVFSMMGDMAKGHEFLMSSNVAGQCHTTGWMMVVTQDNGCTYESGTGTGPQFLYAPGNTAVDFGSSQPQSGDVFAITSHGDCQQQQITQPTGITGTTMGCYYKGQMHQENEQWLDGCESNCTCVDGKTGAYRCTQLCATWNSLPQGCTLEKKPGECCAQPNCGNMTLTPGASFCYYKGQMYTQDQQWMDGCEYKCTCIDASQGRYRCDPRCYTWNLPQDHCHLVDPAPGKCCKTPSCDSMVQINYPPGYVEE